MYGFTIIQGSNSKSIALPFFKRSFKVEAVNDTFFYFGYHFFDKFSNDKIFQEDENYIIGVDGVLLNLQALKNAYGISNYFNLLTHLYTKQGIGFVNVLKGEFCGFVFNKQTLELHFFNNKTATKQVFYSRFANFKIIAPAISTIISFKESLKISSILNVNAVYSLLTFGAMLEEQTLVLDVSKLLAGRYLKLNTHHLILEEYFSFNTITEKITSKKEAIERLDFAFVTAIKLEYEKDKEYNYNHIATLSGGLDSRVNVMIAAKLGYKNTTFCFSEPNYLDAVISQKIATSLGLHHQFISLKNGLYMNDLKENVAIANGTQVFTGAAHYNYSLYKTNLADNGLIHTGQIGDGILGGLLSKGNTPNYLSKIVSNRFLHKVNKTDSFFKNYVNEEVFKLYQRVFNLTHAGSYTTEFHKNYLVSPFLDDDVITTALAIDPKFKKNQNIYIEWLLQKHPETTKFTWERTGFKPNKKWKTSFSRYTNKIKLEYYKFTKQEVKNGMTPENYWLKHNVVIKGFYEAFFTDTIHLLAGNKELFTDVLLYYKEGKSTEKALVLTLLEMVKKFNLKT